MARREFDNQIARTPGRANTVSSERQVGANIGLSVDFIRSEQQQHILKELNLSFAVGVVATGTLSRTNPLIGSVGDWAAGVLTLVNDGHIDYNTIQVSGTKRYSSGWQGRVSYAYSRGRGNTPDGQAVLQQPRSTRRPGARQRSRSDQRRSPPHCDGVGTMCRGLAA